MTTLWKCELCGKKIPEDEVVVVAGKDMCGGCYQENYPRRTVGERAMETLKHDPVHKDVGKSRVPGSRRLTLDEACSAADANYHRVEKALAREVARDAGSPGDVIHEQAMRWLRLRAVALPCRWSWWALERGGEVHLRWSLSGWSIVEAESGNIVRVDRRTARALLCVAEVYARDLDPNEESRQHILPHEGVFNEAEA